MPENVGLHWCVHADGKVTLTLLDVLHSLSVTVDISDARRMSSAFAAALDDPDITFGLLTSPRSP